jgi:hypothetical protein
MNGDDRDWTDLMTKLVEWVCIWFTLHWLLPDWPYWRVFVAYVAVSALVYNSSMTIRRVMRRPT